MVSLRSLYRACLILFLGAIIFSSSASAVNNHNQADQSSEIIDALLSEIERDYVLDKRTMLWEVDVRADEQNLVIEGRTDNKQMVKALQKRLQERSVSADVKVLVLPEDSIEAAEKPWALVNVPVASLTNRPVFAAPLTTQAVLGTPLRVLEYHRPFWRVQTPDGYIGWVHGMQIVRMSQKDLSDWNLSKKVVVTSHTVSMEDASGVSMMPLGIGSILEIIGLKDEKVCVQLPDTRVGYISIEHVQNLTDYAQKWDRLRNEDQNVFNQAFTDLAKQFLGTSYLWGGTSAGGLDCSGFVSLVWRLSGVIVSRDADQQLAQAKKRDFVNPEDIEPGLLLGFGRVKDNGEVVVEHIGISLGKGDFIHSLGSVRIESLSQRSDRYSAYEANRFLGAYELSPTLKQVPCATTLRDNPFFGPDPQRLPPCAAVINK